MQTHTLETIKGVLSADSTVSKKQRHQILQAMQSGEEQPNSSTSSTSKILRRTDVAERFNVSLRTVDIWAKQGFLTKIKLPGRQRACGFSSIEVDALTRGEI